jgi:hypothetical protein
MCSGKTAIMGSTKENARICKACNLGTKTYDAGTFSVIVNADSFTDISCIGILTVVNRQQL